MMQDLELCAPDWIIGWTTSEALLKSLHQNFDFIPAPSELKPAKPTTQHQPDVRPPEPKFVPPQTRTPKEDDFVLRHQWSAIKILEEYDDKETREHCRPYAFIADYVVRVELDVDVNEEMGNMGRMMLEGDHSWFEKLNQQLQPDESIKWYIVVVTDEVRDFGPQEVANSPPELESGEEEISRPSSKGSVSMESPAQDGKSQKKKWSTSVRDKVREKSSIKNLFKKKGDEQSSYKHERSGQ